MNADRRLTLHGAETTALLLIAAVLIVVTGYDTARAVRLDRWRAAELVSWGELTASRGPATFYAQGRNPSINVVCGRVRPRHDVVRYFACLLFRWNAAGRRRSIGGFFFSVDRGRRSWPVRDGARYRYACFGAARADGLRCDGAVPHGAPDRLPKRRTFAHRHRHGHRQRRRLRHQRNVHPLIVASATSRATSAA